MDYRQFELMRTAVPNLYRNSGVLRYGGPRKQEIEDNVKPPCNSPLFVLKPSIANTKTFALNYRQPNIRLHTIDRDSTSSKPRRQDLQVRPCLRGSSISEFKFETELFNGIKVVKQINNNFIATVSLIRNKKVLMLMDQHAIHERIRYESLLRDYTLQGGKLFISAELDVPIVVNDFPMTNCKCLLERSKEVERYGIRFKSEDMRCLVITSIPECLNRKKLNQSRSQLERNVRELVMEMTNDSDWNYTTVPMVIHRAIATEACHGAIRFGEQLDTEQCTKLVRSLMYTEAPSRCAHGRPSIIPLLEFKTSENDRHLISRSLDTLELGVNTLIKLCASDATRVQSAKNDE